MLDTSAKPRNKPMTEGELKGILNAKVTNSLGYYGGKLSKQRVVALQYYQGEPFGNEQEGRSQVVSRDVAEAIDASMPALMKIFASGDEVVRFDAAKPGDEKAAQQATDYCNWIWNQQNQGFRNFFEWFKDALLNKAGAIKIWWDTQKEVTKEHYKGLTDDEFVMLMRDTEDEELELLEHDEYPDPMAAAVSLPPPAPGAPAGPSGMPGAAGAPPPQNAAPAQPGMPAPQIEGPQGIPPILGHNGGLLPMLHDVVVKRTNKMGRVKILPLPGEEFLMDRRAVSLEDTPFVAHRQKKTLSDLKEMGYPEDKIKNLSEGDVADFDLERIERFRAEDELPYRTGNNYDPAMREVWVNECYIKVDYDGDGIAELRKVTFAGDSGSFAPGATEILENEEVDDHPFAAVCPIPMPHKFYGMSLADQIEDLQLIKSTLWRQALDNMYNANMPPLGVIDGQVNLDDLLTRKTGGIVRMKSASAVQELPNPQLGDAPFQMISYVDQVREQRTGVGRFVAGGPAGPNSDALQNAYTSTATGANLVENASQERLELIARCFAELGVKPAFLKILKLVLTHQKKPAWIQMRGQWVPIDPREWNTKFNMTVSVGLGTGNRMQQTQGMSMMLNIDEKIIQMQGGLNGPLVTGQNLYAKLEKLCQFLGFRNADQFYTDPTAHPMQQQPKPDPHVQAAQIKAQADQQMTQVQLQHEQQKTAVQLQADHAKTQSQAALDMQKTQAQMAFEREKMQFQIQADMEIAKAKIAAEQQVQMMRLQAEREEFNAQAHMKAQETESKLGLERQKLNTTSAIEHKRIDTEREFKGKEHEFKVKTTPGAADVMMPKPKMKKIQLAKGSDGRSTAVHRHYDDGSIETIPIERDAAV